MRAFIVLCLVATACAQYNYQAGGNNGGIGSGSNVGPSFGGVGSGSSFGGVGSGPSFGGVGSGPSFGGVGSGPSFGGVGSGPSFGGSSGGPSFGASSSGPSFAAGGPGVGGSQGGFEAASNDAPGLAGQGELEKEFYTFTADEQDFNEPAASNQIASSLKQGLRVVFIKGPENNGLENAALALAKHAADQKTDIYVLSKQADLSDLANKLNNENSHINNKPEVHFVKYRTPEDAANAQKAIQAEYDNLGGQSKHIDGGVAPSLNFASQAPVAPVAPVAPQGSFGAGSGPAGVAAGGPSANYLPASIFRRFRL